MCRRPMSPHSAGRRVRSPRPGARRRDAARSRRRSSPRARRCPRRDHHLLHRLRGQAVQRRAGRRLDDCPAGTERAQQAQHAAARQWQVRHHFHDQRTRAELLGRLRLGPGRRCRRGEFHGRTVPGTPTQTHHRATCQADGPWGPWVSMDAAVAHILRADPAFAAVVDAAGPCTLARPRAQTPDDHFARLVGDIIASNCPRASLRPSPADSRRHWQGRCRRPGAGPGCAGDAGRRPVGAKSRTIRGWRRR